MFQQRPNRNEGGKFLKIVSGQPAVKVILRGEPRLYQVHFDEAAKKSIDCTGPGCPLCRLSASKDRFQVNALTREGDAYVAKILEGNGFMYDTLSDLVAAGYVLQETILLILKEGAGMQTKTKITPSPVRLPAETLQILSQVPLHPIHGEDTPSVPPSDPHFDDVPF